MTEDELKAVLTRKLSLLSPIFELERLPSSKLSGSIISDTFTGLPNSERQKRIWDALDAEYGSGSTDVVGTLLAYTQAEWNVDLAKR